MGEMLRMLAELRSELEAAIAEDDAERVWELVDSWKKLSEELERMMQEEKIMWDEAIATKNRRLLREAEAMADERDACYAELVLIAGKIIVYLTRDESAGSGGGRRSRHGRAATSVWEMRLYA